MNEKKEEQLKAKNDNIISMVIERAKRDFPEDIALIGLTGSFSTGEFHEKSDLDLIIINNTERGWEISSCFILGDVGYDIYCTPWETRITDQANLESSHVSCLLDLKVLYYASQEALDKFNAFRRRALETLARPRGKNSYARAEKGLNQAKLNYADLQLTDEPGRLRFLAASLAENLFNTLMSLNNTYFKRGVMGYLEELEACAAIPGDFITHYKSLIKAKTSDEIRSRSEVLIQSVVRLMEEERKLYFTKPLPTRENLEGTYEELCCNCRNKLIHAVDLGDESLLYLTAKSAQEFLDELAHEIAGTPEFDLMSSFDTDQPELVRDRFLEIMDEFKKEYDKAGRAVKKYDSFEELYRDYMGE